MDAAVKHCTDGIGIWQWASNDQGAAARCRHGLLRRRADAGDPGRRFHPARASARPENPRGQCRGPDEAAAAERTSARFERSRFRRAVHQGQTCHLRLPRLSLADPPADLSPHQPRQHSRPRLQGRRHHHHALRYDGAERSGPLPPGQDTIDRMPQTGKKGRLLKQQMQDKLIEHKHYIDQHGQDLPEIRNWKWKSQ